MIISLILLGLSLIAAVVVAERWGRLASSKRVLPKDWTSKMEYRAQYQEIKRAEILKWIDSEHAYLLAKRNGAL